MKKYSVVFFASFVAVYLPAFVISMTGIIAEGFGYKLLSPEVGGMMMLMVIIYQFGWGLVAGPILNRRGWSMVGETRSLHNAFALCVINFCFTAPLVAMAAIERYRHGKFFPAPSEC